MIDPKDWRVRNDRGYITLNAGNESSGVTIALIKKRKELWISGHYDHMVGIPGAVIKLSDLAALFKTSKR